LPVASAPRTSAKLSGRSSSSDCRRRHAAHLVPGKCGIAGQGGGQRAERDLALTGHSPDRVDEFSAGGSTLSGGLAILAAIAIVVLVLQLSSRVGPSLARLLSHDSDEQVLLRALGLTLVVAGLAEHAGISAAVGAFLVGLAIPGATSAAARRVLDPLRDLFAAAFFLSFGFHTDPADIPPVLPAALALAVTTALTKVGTGWYAARRDGVGPRGRWRAGLVLVARGEFSLVIAGLATAAGVARLGQVAAAYVMILAVAGPVLARIAGRRRDPPRPGTAAALNSS
jgi:monovalent cation:H+ antiporter-2, CPA2 family